jgi:nicotinamide-nucleotide amidase
VDVVDLVPLAARVHSLLQARGESVATAESLTGGRLAAALTAVPGGSASYVGGVVAYATAVKVSVLGVPQSVVDTDGVVSAPCAVAMAQGVARLTGSTYALATTGVAGPDLQEGHPAGTVYVGIHGPDGTSAGLLELAGGREEIAAATCENALSALAGMLERR